MKNHLIKFVATGALAAGMTLAQTTPAPAPQPNHAQTRVRPHTMFRQRMMQALNLTPEQREHAQTMFHQARQKAEPIRRELKQNREELAASVKADNTAQVRSLAAKQGKLEGELLGIRSETMAKFYSTLTPEQRAKADQLHQQMRQHFQERSQHRQGGNG
jgi:Spy/CpxP family protein refolding chaperone